MSTSPTFDASGDSNTRKRVCKACDRCRLKKSKCDGSSPCSRCKADNAICVFGERKKSQDKVYPKGYVEQLEQQQVQMVAGLQELYRRCLNNEGWSGPPLDQSQGHPLTHDILKTLDVLHVTDLPESQDPFEENFPRMQQRLLSHGAKLRTRRGSLSSDSDRDHLSADSGSPHSATHTQFTDPFKLNRAPPTPPTRSPFQAQFPNIKSEVSPNLSHSNPWRGPTANAPETIIPSNWPPQDSVMMEDGTIFSDTFDSPISFDAPLGYEHFALRNGMPGGPPMDIWESNPMEDQMRYESMMQNGIPLGY